MEKTLVTGGMGFIGSHLLNRLMPNNQIDVVDNFANNSINKIEEVNVYRQSVKDFDIEKKEYDTIYHLASPVGPAGVLKYAGEMGSVIVNDALKIAKYGYEHQCRVIFISTSEVYGFHPGGREKQKEDINKIVPSKITIRLEYGTAKLLMEICINNFAREHPFPFNIVRPFNTVGCGQSSKTGFVIPRFVYQALTDKPMTVFGTGSQLRTFTYVGDTIDALIAIIKSDIRGEIFNIGNPDNIMSVKDLAYFIRAMAKSNSGIVYIDPKTVYGDGYEEAWNKIPDIQKIQDALKWKPATTIKEIINEVILDTKEMIETQQFRPNHAVE